MSGVPVTFRVTYARYGELRDDIAHQMVRGGLLVKVHDAPELGFDSPVSLELVLPDGTTLYTAGKVLQVFSGFGIAVSVEAQVVEEVGRLASRPDTAGSGAARHERIDLGGRSRIRPPTARPGSPTRPQALGTGSLPSPIGTGTSPPIGTGTSPPAFGTGSSPPIAAGSSPAMSPPTSPALSPPLAPRSSPSITLPPAGRSSPSITLPPAGRSSPAITLPSAGRSSPSITPPPATAGGNAADAPRAEGTSRMEKVQLALHGTRDERNAILRDRDRTLYSFVLKNPQLDADDVVAIAKNGLMTSELLKQIGERKDWLQRPAVALALARNPRTPPELAVRALDHVPLEALRQMAKGTGVPPHVTQAARKKLLG